MTRLAALALALAATPAAAAPLTPWEPGASPCAGACSLEWALEQTGAPAGEMVPMTIPAGTPIEWMSYARNGVPYGLDYHGRPTLRPLAAVGYHIGGGVWLVEFEECRNKAEVLLVGGAVALLADPARPDARPVSRVPGPVPAALPPGSTPRPPGVIEPPDDPRPEPPVVPVPVPLPFVLLASALAGLGLMRRRG